MRKIRFDEDEKLVIAILKEDTYQETIGSLETALDYLEEKYDIDLYMTMVLALSKLRDITEEEYNQMDLSDILIPEEEEDEERE